MIPLRMLPVIALYMGSAVFITGLASLGAVSAFETSATWYTGLWWGAFAGCSVIIMAALAHWMPEWWIEKKGARVFFGAVASVCCFIIAWWFDFSAVANLLEKVEVRQQTNYKSRNVVEKSDAEVTADIARLQNELAELDKERLVDNGVERKYRAVGVIEKDGGYTKSNGCSTPTTAYQRVICREYESAKEKVKKEKELAALKAEAKGVRNTIATTSAVVSSGNVAAERFAQVMGWKAETTNTWQPVIFTLFAEIMCLILPGLAGWARLGAHAQASHAPAPISGHGGQPFHFHINAAPASAPAPLALAAPGRAYDPAKQAMLIGRFWTELLPTLPKERQGVGKFLPKFDNLCAAEGVETPTQDVFRTLSAAHLPNVMPMAGELWFTPT